MHQGNKSQPSLGCLPDTVVPQGNKSQPSFRYSGASRKQVTTFFWLPSRYSAASRKQVTTFFWLPSRYSAASRKQVTTFFWVPSRYSAASRKQVTTFFRVPSRLPSLECIEVISKYSWCKGCPGPRGKHQTRGEPSIEPLSNYCPKWRNSRTVEKTRYLALVHYMSHHSNPELSLHWAATVSCQRSVCQVPGR